MEGDEQQDQEITRMPNMGEHTEHHQFWATWQFWVAVVLIVGGIWWFSGQPGGITPGGVDEEVEIIGEGQELRRPTEEGEVISNFPEEFLTEVRDGAPVLDSYSIRYTNEGAEQPVVTYLSNQPLADNVNVYAVNLSSAGWTVVNEASPDASGTTNYYARRDNEEVNITFKPVAEGTQVTIAYLIK